MEKVISVISGKGGVGKTTFTSNVGLALSRIGTDVTVLDGDMSNSNLGLQLGFFQFPLGLQDALSGNIGISKAVYTHPSGLRVIPSSISMEYLRRGTPDRLKRLLAELSGLIIVDSPPGIGPEVESIIKASDDVLIITNPEIPAVTDALKAAHVTRGLGKEPLGIVMNRTGDKYDLRPEEVETMCGVRVIGSIPDDRAIKRSIFNRNPVLHDKPLSKSSMAFMEIAASLAGQEFKSPRMLGLRRLIRR
jgi:septum site-determining protein MinD